ncbi:MAG: fucose isomerase [Verrucomicrobiia bacterium]
MSTSALATVGVTQQALANLLPPLPLPAPSRLVLVSCGVRIHFPWKDACEGHQRALAELRLALPGESFEVVDAGEPFEDPEALLAFLDRELAGGIAGLVLFHAAYTAGEIGSRLGRWLIEHPVPVLSWSFPDVQGGNLRANSLCCQNFILGMWRAMEVPYVWMHQEVGEAARPMLIRFARSARARGRFRSAKVLHAGGSRVTAFYDGETDELAVMRQFGLRFDRVDLEAVFADGRKRFSDAALRPLRDAIVQSPHCARNDVPDAQIFQTLRLGATILAWAGERGYCGCTIKSWPELFDQYGCAADGAVSMLNDAGFCTAEEGEMNGLLSSLSLHFLSEGSAVATMMDLSVLDAAADRIGIWHCGACPTRLLRRGTRYEARKHSILENADPETAVGLMLEFLLETGPVTVMRYQSPDAGKWFAFEGEIVESPMAFRGNYGALAPRKPHTAAAIMGTILDRGLDHHWSLGRGHWHEELRLLNHWLGVEEIACDHVGGPFGLSRRESWK